MSMAENAWLRLREGHTSLEGLVRMMPYDAIVDFGQQSHWKQDAVPVAV